MKIKDWDVWQSYRKDRGAPPWIKVHRSLLSNQKWAVLSDAEKGQIISMWIVAADNNGELPDDAKILRKICQLDDIPDVKKFKELGFFVDDGNQCDANVTPKCQQHDAPEEIRGDQSRVEKRREEKKEGARVNATPNSPKGISFRNWLEEIKKTDPEIDGEHCPDLLYDESERIGLPDSAIRQWAVFHDHWMAQTGQKAVKADWVAAWRNWLRRDFGNGKR